MSTLTRDFTGYEISTGFLTGNLFSGGEWDSIDEGASAAKYAEFCREELERSFPGAKIEVNYQDGEGSLPYPLKTRVSWPGMDDDFEAGDRQGNLEITVEDICSRAFENWEAWVVEA